MCLILLYINGSQSWVSGLQVVLEGHPGGSLQSYILNCILKYILYFWLKNENDITDTNVQALDLI